MNLLFDKASVDFNKMLACKQHTNITKTLITVIVAYGKCAFQTNIESLDTSKIIYTWKKVREHPLFQISFHLDWNNSKAIDKTRKIIPRIWNMEVHKVKMLNRTFQLPYLIASTLIPFICYTFLKYHWFRSMGIGAVKLAVCGFGSFWSSGKKSTYLSVSDMFSLNINLWFK